MKDYFVGMLIILVIINFLMFFKPEKNFDILRKIPYLWRIPRARDLMAQNPRNARRIMIILNLALLAMTFILPIYLESKN